jgi:hypothetical protein
MTRPGNRKTGFVSTWKQIGEAGEHFTALANGSKGVRAGNAWSDK